MAQVLAPIVQTSGSITMLHSSSDAFQNQSTTQSHHQQPRTSQMQRSQGYNGQNGNTGYRSTSAAPIAPYAFSSTPQLRQENRTSSAPGIPYTQQQNAQVQQPARLGHPSHPSSSSDSTVSTSGSSSRSIAGQPFSKDDTAITADQRKSTATINLSTSVPDLTLAPLDAPVKPSPGRYRRGVQRTDSNSSVTPTSTPTPTQQSHQAAPLSSSKSSEFRLSVPTFSDLDITNKPSHARANSADDLHVPRPGAIDQAKRYRRRSLGNVGAEATALAAQAPAIAPMTPIVTPPPSRSVQEFRPSSSSGRPSSRSGSRPESAHERQGSSGSTSSTASARPSSRQESRPNMTKQTNASLRGSADPSKRVTAPSPLSKPLSPSEPSSPTKRSPLASDNARSPAMQQLSALNDKESGKGMKSRLRRAFSFGSAAELRRASAENNLSAERAKLRKDKYQDERDAETEAIIAKQEAAGIGAGIYSGQGGFSGSTDNLSISSTASSASIMLRKMGSGMKKGGRSIKGLFRPKSVIGVPAADTVVTQPSAAQVSMVTVEAEREKVNVNANPHDQVGGGTGYPRLERNSLDAGRTADVNGISGGPIIDSRSRKTIVGGDRERAEILSSMKKGILKRTGTSSETPSPVAKPSDVPHETDTPKSSAPSTPNDDHARPIQVHINGEDYFGGTPRIPNASTRSLPTTPHGNRNISFSPRIQFHDAWSASDYDRRGDIATCNRLTPMLAQQIKEELNSFKMEMEVHELSKPHTHFF